MPTSVPTHVGLILDGNRRWANEHGLSPMEGHRRGYLQLEKISQAAFERGVACVSAFVFSTENWSRNQEEVSYIMDLLKWAAAHKTKKLHKNNVKLIFAGREQGLDPGLLKTLRQAEAITANNTGGTLAICINYGGQQEITDAMAKIVRESVSPKDLTPELIAKHLYQPSLPPVDLVIRTSGEQRLSGFMLWSAAYAELLFIDKYWPDLTPNDLNKALDEYAGRQRRFGR